MVEYLQTVQAVQLFLLLKILQPRAKLRQHQRLFPHLEALLHRVDFNGMSNLAFKQVISLLLIYHRRRFKPSILLQLLLLAQVLLLQITLPPSKTKQTRHLQLPLLQRLSLLLRQHLLVSLGVFRLASYQEIIHQALSVTAALL